MQQACGIIAQNTRAAEVECSAAATADQALVVLMLFVLFVSLALFLLVPPFPVIPLVLRPEMFVIYVIVVAFRQPLNGTPDLPASPNCDSHDIPGRTPDAGAPPARAVRARPAASAWPLRLLAPSAQTIRKVKP